MAHAQLRQELEESKL